MEILTQIWNHIPPLAWQITGGVVAAVLILAGLRKVLRYVVARPLEDVLTIVAAGVATGVSAQGMWKFAGDVLHLDGFLRVALFSFIELAMMTSAVRARRAMRESSERAKTNTWETPSAGIDGIAVWALTCLTAVLSAMDASGPAEFVFRLAAPLVAAWLWERGMAVERRRITGLTGIHWRVTPERILVRLGLAEAKDRTASEVDAHRRLTKVALAAKKARALREAGAEPKKVAAAMARLDRALERAVEHTALARDRAAQAALLDQLSTLYGAPRLLDLPGQAPWEHLDHPAVTGLIRDSEALILAAALERNTALRSEIYPLPPAGRDRPPAAPAAEPQPADDVAEPDAEALPPSPEGAAWLARIGWRTRPLPRPDADPSAVQAEEPEPDAGPDAEADAEPNANEPADASGTRPDAILDDDRKEPTEQDKRRVARWWVKRVKAGEVLGRYRLAERTGFKSTWCGDRITEGREILAAEGWTFDGRGNPIPPSGPDAEADAEPNAVAVRVNGSHPAGGEV
ncbi:hypothetical protein ACWEU6_21990 [Streptosporangium sandarakinum]